MTMLLSLTMALSLGASPSSVPLGDLQGGWELVQAPRFDPQGAWPWGIENRRYVFDEKGRWFSLASDERLSKAKPIGSVERLAADRVRFHTPEGKAPESQIRISGAELKIIHGEHSTWIYQRISDSASLDRPVATRSLELLEVDQSTSAASRFGDYLQRSQVQSSITDPRLHGVWELVRVRGVPIEDRPEQGYYNDVLVVAPTHFCFVQRASQNGAVCADAEQDKATRIQLKDDAGNKATALQVHFTEFDQLELSDGDFVQTFDRIGTDAATAPAVPLKIAIYRD
jgi:hypothetical protein